MKSFEIVFFLRNVYVFREIGDEIVYCCCNCCYCCNVMVVWDLSGEMKVVKKKIIIVEYLCLKEGWL